MLDRRALVASAILGGSLALLRGPSARAAQPKVIVLGYQKTGIPLLARQLGVYERRFKPLGIRVNWVEFGSGLLLLQAMDAAAVDFGNSGDVGALFLQAAGGAIVYTAAQPTGPHSEGILVRAETPIRRVADLKGKRVAFARGSSSHNVTVAALESAGLSIHDIDAVNLSAQDGAFAFAKGAVDAWTVWDPYFTLAQNQQATRVLAYTGDVLKNNAGFLLANKDFAARNPDLVAALVEGAEETGAWSTAHPKETTAALAAATGIDPKVMAQVVRNASFRVTPVTEAIIAGQQATADRFLRLGLLPRAVRVSDAVWRPIAHG
jgi:sulfonate transport system substrate-binding protein